MGAGVERAMGVAEEAGIGYVDGSSCEIVAAFFEKSLWPTPPESEGNASNFDDKGNFKEGGE